VGETKAAWRFAACGWEILGLRTASYGQWTPDNGQRTLDNGQQLPLALGATLVNLKSA